MKNWVCDGLLNFFEAPRMVHSALGGAIPRAEAAPVAPSLGKGEAHVRSSRRHGSSLRGLAPVSGTCHVELDKLLKLSDTKSKISPKRLLVEFVFFRFSRILSQNACLVVHFSTSQICKSNQTKKILSGYHKKQFLVKIGPIPEGETSFHVICSCPVVTYKNE